MSERTQEAGQAGGQPSAAADADAGKVTIYDVAAASGFSPSTVSRTFSRPDRVSIATAQKVEEVANRLGYHSQLVGTRPAKDKGLVAVVVPDIGNQFFTGIIRNIQDACDKHGMNVMVLETRESATKERKTVDQVAPLVAGIILISSRMPDAMIRKCAQLRPLVCVNRDVRGVPGISIDVPAGARQAVDHLYRLGYRSISYLDGPATSWSGGLRWREIVKQGEAKGMAVWRSQPFAPTFYGGYTFAEQYLKNPSGALIAHNDLMAIGFIAAMRHYGFRCPEDISVIGFDNDMMSMISNPPLTTIHMSLSSLGSFAAQLLFQRLAGAHVQQLNDSSIPSLVPARLIVRQSTGPASHRARPSAQPVGA
ncbi:LacI family transcriptional regulator [Bombiscardovia nodaiensis]|uniref:LacI family transcriptional regulator n=1 Tax=Bombiscardovia nodaiensis TaxID=2932181 RepID=A0ABM8B6D2_9BIFI|nr:LacI family transcriptional regulator [Bombiscardovia nodaiensis]